MDNSQDLIPTSVRVTASLLKEAKTKAKKMGISVSIVLRRALEDFVKGNYNPFEHTL